LLVARLTTKSQNRQFYHWPIEKFENC